MSEQSHAGPAEGLEPGEKGRLAHALETRCAVHLEAAAAAVRQAEQNLATAQDRLAQARLDAERAQYQSDALVFMRQGVSEELEGLGRKTTPKNLRASYRFLLDRAVELAAGEVQRFHDDQDAAERKRESGVEACIAAEQRATETLAAAHDMQERVRAAEHAAREGLAVLVDKLAHP